MSYALNVDGHSKDQGAWDAVVQATMEYANALARIEGAGVSIAAFQGHDPSGEFVSVDLKTDVIEGERVE